MGTEGPVLDNGFICPPGRAETLLEMEQDRGNHMLPTPLLTVFILNVKKQQQRSFRLDRQFEVTVIEGEHFLLF